MKRRLMGWALVIGLMVLRVGSIGAAEEDKPLAPGWLSLDCCVGPVDDAIGKGKSALEKALGITIGGYLDTGWTL
ncbi:MAG TPA: hypothetical protein VNM15_10570, partial [Candidatus Binatia bacterium]|nr:hypothetical protein [Candidatus Binatia bacterium]